MLFIQPNVFKNHLNPSPLKVAGQVLYIMMQKNFIDADLFLEFSIGTSFLCHEVKKE